MWDMQKVEKSTTLFERWVVTIQWCPAINEFEARLKDTVNGGEVAIAYGVDEQDTLANLASEIESFIEGLSKVKERINEEAK